MPPSVPNFSGGCQCGAIRFKIVGSLGPADICHCRMCQKAFGSWGAVLARTELKQLEWTRGKPATFKSSAVVERGFCKQCGTPLFMYEIGDSAIDIAVGALDNPNAIEKLITPNTSAILATHVYGFACDVHKIEEIAKKHNLKVIYDGAHAFDVKLNDISIFNFGDVSTISFHATKLYHTIEGGAIITKDNTLAEKLVLYRSFGHIADNYYSIGINGKNSEFHAAMGLCNLPKVADIIENRKKTALLYKSLLINSNITFPQPHPQQNSNYAYFPVVFKNEETLLKVRAELVNNSINTRRYFYPSLNSLPYLSQKNSCPVSEDISLRVLCLPLYYGLEEENVKKICKIINTIVEK